MTTIKTNYNVTIGEIASFAFSEALADRPTHHSSQEWFRAWALNKIAHENDLRVSDLHVLKFDVFKRHVSDDIPSFWVDITWEKCVYGGHDE